MTPEFHPAATQEIAAAWKVGEERGFGHGRELVQEIRRVAALLCDAPGEPLDSSLRRFPFRKFPFALISSVSVTSTSKHCEFYFPSGERYFDE